MNSGTLDPERAREYVKESEGAGKSPEQALMEFLEKEHNIRIRPLEDTDRVLREVDDLGRTRSTGSAREDSLENLDDLARRLGVTTLEETKQSFQSIEQMKAERIAKLERSFLDALDSLGPDSALHLLPLMMTAAGDKESYFVRRLKDRVAPEFVQIHKELRRYEIL